MPLTTDERRIRTALDRDRAWCAYAIGDLDPTRHADCSWYAPAADPDGLVLLYRGFAPPILFAIGDPASLAATFAELDTPVVSLQLRTEAAAALPSRYGRVTLRPMWRMALDATKFSPALRHEEATPLTRSDAEAVAALYADGRSSGEAPPFYDPSMLDEGSFRGVWHGSELVAVAGTHLFSPALGVCAIGNVYTRRDHRGWGFAARATSAVIRHALAATIPTIVLNVSQTNDGARRVYAQLGFGIHCPFVEGEAASAGSGA